MTTTPKEIEEQALKLPPKERRELIHRLIFSLEAMSDDNPEAIAKGWDEEIARRNKNMEAGETAWISAEDMMARLNAALEKVRKAP